jgi:dipeptidyl aminopeptidase/acylaminoacyl peptidase
MTKILKVCGMAAGAVVFTAVAVLAIAGVPAPPSIKATGIPRVPWSPLAEAVSFVKNMIAAESLVDWHPSGEGIVVRKPGLTGSALYRVRTPGAEPEKLMSLTRNTERIYLNPDLRRNYLVYSEDTAGNEYSQLYLYDLNTQKSRRITDGSSRHIHAVFAPDGERLAFPGRARNSDDTLFYVVDPLNPSTMRTIGRAAGEWWLGAWSPGGDRVLAWKNIPPNLSFLYSLDVRTGELRHLGSGKEGEVTHRDAVWSNDGRSLYYAGDWHSEFLTLRRIDLETGREEELSGGIPSDVTGLNIASDDSLLVVRFNREGANYLYVLDTKTKAITELPDVPSGSIATFGFHPRARKLAWDHVAFDSTQSISGYDFTMRTHTAWRPASPGASGGPVQPRLIHYPTFDSVDGKPRMIPAWFWQARSADGRPTPVLVNIHGGPAGQSGPINRGFGMLARRGISQIQPNVRGSTGYGKSYRKLDDGRLRTDAVKDIGALLDWIGTQPNLDSTRIAVFGSSYGGFMALASAVQFSDRLACAIDFSGVSNFVNRAQETREDMREWARVEYGDERDPEIRRFLESISPLNHHDRITVPLFIFQGANDTRVPVGESRRMVAGMRTRGQPVWYIEAADQGHSMPSPVNSFYVVPAGLTFLERCLLDGRPKR